MGARVRRPPGSERRARLYRKEVQFVALFWNGLFNFYERFPKETRSKRPTCCISTRALSNCQTCAIFTVDNGLSVGRVMPGTCLWVTEYSLPVEGDSRFESYLERAQQLLERGVLTSAAQDSDRHISDPVPDGDRVRDARIRQCEETLRGRDGRGAAGSWWKRYVRFAGRRPPRAPGGIGQRSGSIDGRRAEGDSVGQLGLPLCEADDLVEWKNHRPVGALRAAV